MRVLIELDFAAVDALQDFWVENLFRRPLAGSQVIEAQDIGRIAVHDAEVMSDQDQSEAPLALSSLQQRVDRLLAADVYSGRRLIKQQHVGVIHRCPGDQHPLELPRGQNTQLPLGEVAIRDSHLREQAGDVLERCPLHSKKNPPP